ncbi:MAG: accessory Sec system translocase SecA2 [Acidobacteriota bacterium]
MSSNAWKRRLQEWRGGPIETNLTVYETALRAIGLEYAELTKESDAALKRRAADAKARTQAGVSPDQLLLVVFALAREAAHRVLGLRPYDVQVIAAAALHHGKLVEMQTGEGKTLVAVLPATLNALSGRGVHVLTFNDYLARRDAMWMGPVYKFLGLSVAFIQEGMSLEERRDAYLADITYATAKEAAFDFLRMHLARRREDLVHRGFNYAIIDEADSILIDEARSPLVIAGNRVGSETSPYRIAGLVGQLNPETDWETDQNARNVFLTESGINLLEKALACGDLHATENFLRLTEVNQALHVRALLRRDVDYIVRDGRIELVDEFTGRVVEDRRWPDGLQAALEAKEGLEIRPGGRVLGSTTLQHFLGHYTKLSGMTATAQTSAEEFKNLYDLNVVHIPANRLCIREDQPDVLFTHKEAKNRQLVREIGRLHASRRPILVGTSTIEESEALATRLGDAGVECRILNAKNDEAEAEIIAQAGALGAVTISTNMAGRGTDIKLGGASEKDRAVVVEIGGLYVIGTNRHESRRIDNQLRGRAGRQGDPGTSRFFVSLEDDLMKRFGIERLIPEKIRPSHQDAPIDNPVVRGEVERLQRTVDGQNYEIRKTLARYSAPIEEQRKRIHEWRMAVLLEEESVELCASGLPDRYRELCERFGAHAVEQVERAITLHHIDECWSEHLSFVTQLREGIHLEELRRKDPLLEFHKQAAEGFWKVQQKIEERILGTFAKLEMSADGITLGEERIEGPASTWTYLINDRAFSQMQQMLFGPAGSAFAVGAVISTWPLIAAWAIWKRFTRRRS